MAKRSLVLFAMAVILTNGLAFAADTAATQTAASRNMTGVAKAAIVNAMMNGGKLPEHLAVLVASGETKTEYLIDPRTDHKPLAAPTEKDWKKISADVDAHCDFYYVGAVTPDDAGSMIILYDKGGTMRLVTFADGHTEAFKPASPELKAAVKKSNDLDKNPVKLPENLDGPPVRK